MQTEGPREELMNGMHMPPAKEILPANAALKKGNGEAEEDKMEQDNETCKNAEKHKRLNQYWREADKTEALSYEKDLLQYLIQRVRILGLQEFPQLRQSLVELGANPNLFPENISSPDRFNEWKAQAVVTAKARIEVIYNLLAGAMRSAGN